MEDGDITARAKRIVELKRDGRIAAALEKAEALAAEHPRSLTAACLLGDLHYSVAIGARAAAAGSEKEPADAESHLRQGRDALLTAKSLAPDNADIAVALADLLAESSMYLEAEAELRRLMDVAKSDDVAAKRKLQALQALKEARDLAMRFPGSARARLLGPFLELQYMLAVSREHKDPSWSNGVERLVCDAVGAAKEFPNSTAAALFQARLLFVCGNHIDAEGECHRALALQHPTDPVEDCIPTGSIRGEDPQSRLSSVTRLFRDLLDKILQSAESYWENCLTSEKRQSFLSVRIDALENKCKMVEHSYDFSVSSACRFFKEHKSWRSWVCPLCSAKHTSTRLLLKHMVKRHSRSVLRRLQDIVDPTDSENHDTICFKERDEMFRLLFLEPNRGEVAKPVDKFHQDQQSQGTLLLENIKKNMVNLPTHKSATYESSNLQEIRELWLQFLECAVLDYGKSIVTLARSYLWDEFRKCMAGDREALRQKISADDIETTFSSHSAVDKETMKEEVLYQTGETPTLTADQDTRDSPSSNSHDINLVDIILRTLWCMEPLLDEVMKTKPICSKHGHGEPCVGVIVHKILHLWEKAEDHQQQLLPLANTVCRTLEDDNCFDERQDRSKRVSDTTVAILNGLHLPDVCLQLGIMSDTMRPETEAFVCKYHYPPAMKPMRPMGCGCKTCSPGQLNADPSKVEHICKQCSSAALKDPYSAVVIHCSMKMEDQQSLAEIWDDTLQPLMTFEYNHGTIFYGLAAMVLRGRGILFDMNSHEKLCMVFCFEMHTQYLKTQLGFTDILKRP
ncbi:hypothetical protein VPH35_027833 [Triticum aestivum]